MVILLVSKDFWISSPWIYIQDDSIFGIDKFCYLKPFLCDSAKIVFPVYPFHQWIILKLMNFWNKIMGIPRCSFNVFMRRFVELSVIRNNSDIYGWRKMYDEGESSVKNLKSLQMDKSCCRAFISWSKLID